MSLLADIETTFDNGTVLSTRNKVFDVLFNDMLVLSNDPNISVRHMMLLSKKTFSMVKAYELVDKFGVELHELKLFLSSGYIMYSTFHNMNTINDSKLIRVYGNDIGTGIDFNIDLKTILEYLDNPSVITQSYYNYCCSQQICERRDVPAYNIEGYSIPDYHYFTHLFKKQILDFNVLIGNKFWEEFEEYAKDKITRCVVTKY